MTLPHLSREIYTKEMTKIPLLIYHLPSSMWRVHVWVYCYELTSAQQYFLHFMGSSAGLGHQMLVSDQITLITTSYHMLTTCRWGVHARQHHAVQVDLTALPGCRGLDPRGVLTWTVFASPGAGNMLFSPPSTINHYRTDGGVPGGAALSVKLTAKRARTIKLICSLFGILFC